jgi:hypothetical protein
MDGVNTDTQSVRERPSVSFVIIGIALPKRGQIVEFLYAFFVYSANGMTALMYL